jgi:hypothetical protein
MQNKNIETQRMFDFSSFSGDWEKTITSCMEADGEQSVHIGEYIFNTVGVDKRNIATGGASDYEFVVHYPRPKLADSYAKPQWMPILTIMAIVDSLKPKDVLFVSASLDRFKIKQVIDNWGSNVTLLNSKKLNIYEKFCSGKHEQTPEVDYAVMTMQELLDENTNKKFDFILGWSSDFDSPLVPVDTYVNSLASGGVLAIQNASDSVFLYSNDTPTSPVFEMHRRLKAMSGLRVYHIPIFYGITLVIKD